MNADKATCSYLRLSAFTRGLNSYGISHAGLCHNGDSNSSEWPQIQKLQAKDLSNW
jgi:hypothetical protein